jgi:NAD+ kinase
MSNGAFSRVCVLANRQAHECAAAEQALRAQLEKDGFSLVDEPRDDTVDVLVVLGGDGFLMEVLPRFDFPTMPIFGVNFGTVGFHMNSQSSLDELPKILRAGGQRLETYPLLAVIARHEDGTETRVHAFNDVLLERETRQSVRLRVWLDEILFNRFAGDGFVVATAAGSTAYNLAAGGPAVHPGLEAMVLTPLYPHQAVPFSSVQFSLTLPLSSRLRFQADDLPKRGMRLVADGRPYERVESAEVSDSGRRITLLRTPASGFSETLSRKIIGS